MVSDLGFFFFVSLNTRDGSARIVTADACKGNGLLLVPGGRIAGITSRGTG